MAKENQQDTLVHLWFAALRTPTKLNYMASTLFHKDATFCCKITLNALSLLLE